MRVSIFILLPMLAFSFCSAQNTKIRWDAFTMGYAKSQMENTVMHSVGGQIIAGPSRGSNIQIASGFLADTLFQKVLVGVIRPEDGVPGAYALAQNYPNPFNPSTTIHFEIPAKSAVTLKVYNVLGQEIRTLINNDERAAGRYNVRFDALGLPSGAYFYRLVAGTYVETKKLLLLK